MKILLSLLLFCDFKSDFILESLQEVKVTSPDYKGGDYKVSKDTAVEDFKMRIHHYEMSYEPLDEERDKDLSFIRIYNQGEKFLVNKVQGRTSFMGMDNDRLVVWLEYAYSYQISTYLTSNHECLTVKILLVYLCHTLLFILGHVESRVVYYLMNIHVLPRTIYITRVSFLGGLLFKFQTLQYGKDLQPGVSKHSKHSTVALLCYFLPGWCYFSFLVMKGAMPTGTCATAKSNLDTPASLIISKQYLTRLLLDTMKHCCQLYMNWTFTCFISL